MTYLEILKWNERDILNSIEKEKQKPQNDLTKYYINQFEKMLADIQKQIAMTILTKDWRNENKI